MPVKANVLAEKKVSGIIVSMNNAMSSQALMKQDDAYRQVQSTPHGSGLATPVFVTPSPVGQRKANINSPNHISKRQWLTMAILTFINLINYMDRYTIAGLIRDVQDYYSINDSQAGALQTVFVSSYMVVAPIFGYLGDRHSRRWLMALGVGIWVVAVFLGSFMTGFTGFMVMRAIVGVGEASYSTIAPTIISDIFVKEARSKCLAIFYFAIPVGSGLGYVVGQELASAFGSWQWAMRGTPVFGLVAVILIIFCLEDPPRGGAEGQDHLEASTYKEDIIGLLSNGSFLLSTLGFTCVTFCTGALSWWGPKFLQSAVYIKEVPVEDRPIPVHSIALVFGVMTMVAGIVGVPLGALLSTKLKRRFPRTDPTICGVGLAVTCVLFGVALFYVLDTVFMFALVLIFLGEITLNLNWSIVADILLYVVAPNRRGTAEALQILFSHLFGDAGSPYLIGVVSDALRNSSLPGEHCHHLKYPDVVLNIGKANQTRCEATVEYFSMRQALIANVAVVALGAVFFFLCTIYIVKDKLVVDRFLADSREGKSGEHKSMLMNPTSLNGDAEDPEFTDEDEPPTIVVNGGKILTKAKLNDNLNDEKMYSGGIVALNRLVDSDSSLNSSSSSSCVDNSRRQALDENRLRPPAPESKGMEQHQAR